MSDDLVLRETRGPILLATLNRPTKGNALNRPILAELDQVIHGIELGFGTADAPRVLVITGSGSKAFCAGADVTELNGIGEHRAREQMRYGQLLFDRLEALPVPVIAAINGFALGGGLELAMACDIRVAAATARLGQAEINLANLPGWGGTQRLPRLVGRGIANEMIFGGETITAARAHETGLVNRVADDAVAAALEMASLYATKDPTAIRGAKRAIGIGLQPGLTEGLIAEADAVATSCATEAQQAAVAAFLTRGKSQ
ncbi:Short-chain-enoyl-CoA hydratase [Propionicimonas sp. T2.31MG-18]|uniref:enoyl-CoA hydratase/isomerase family protein n=1 Tax=Propionicimonas sp. T2.31MG-18 TaxID=3157620 RepID=UPI0035E49E98